MKVCSKHLSSFKHNSLSAVQWDSQRSWTNCRISPSMASHSSAPSFSPEGCLVCIILCMRKCLPVRESLWTNYNFCPLVPLTDLLEKFPQFFHFINPFIKFSSQISNIVPLLCAAHRRVVQTAVSAPPLWTRGAVSGTTNRRKPHRAHKAAPTSTKQTAKRRIQLHKQNTSTLHNRRQDIGYWQRLLSSAHE